MQDTKSNIVQVESENEQPESVKLVNIDDLLRNESSNDKNHLDEYKHWIKPITILHEDSTIQGSNTKSENNNNPKTVNTTKPTNFSIAAKIEILPTIFESTNFQKSKNQIKKKSPPQKTKKSLTELLESAVKSEYGVYNCPDCVR